ncbi:MAG: AmmeMemoRadiSam system protein B [Ignavibacteria bacterium]|nr:AmmeMemoRadiSam system protein B [Ignavibacteria bacterium]
MRERIRKASVAGTFYPETPQVLRDEIEQLLRQCGGHAGAGRVKGLVVPHAGYLYSGLTAAHGYCQVRNGTYDAVIIIGPSHRECFDGVSVFDGTAYETPLGLAHVETRVAAALAESGGSVEMSSRGHGMEHSVEVQIPFLQVVLPGVRIVPVIMGSQRKELCLELGCSLRNIMSGRNVLVIASTDLSHYHQEEEAERLDRVMVTNIRRHDYLRLLDDLETGRTEACGGGPAVALLSALSRQGGRPMDILHYATSGDVTGGRDSVVGYLSAAAYA